MRPKLVKQKVVSLGDKTGSDHLYDNQKETGKGNAVKRARLQRRPLK